MTLDQLIDGWLPCWLTKADGAQRIKKLAGRRKDFSLKHIQALFETPAEDLSVEDWFWVMERFLQSEGLVVKFLDDFRPTPCVRGPSSPKHRMEDALDDMHEAYDHGNPEPLERLLNWKPSK